MEKDCLFSHPFSAGIRNWLTKITNPGLLSHEISFWVMQDASPGGPGFSLRVDSQGKPFVVEFGLGGDLLSPGEKHANPGIQIPLLPHFQDLFFVRGEKGWTTVGWPTWFPRTIGKSPIDLEQSDPGKSMEPSLPGLVELLDRVSQGREPVRGFQTTLSLPDGDSRGIVLDAVPSHLPDGREGVTISVQETPLPTGIGTRDLSEVTFFGLIGASPGMGKVFNKIRMYASSDAPVLVFGETGAGKEGVAHALHEAGPRRNGPFVSLNCSAITESLFESELFGHEKGSFTGAIRSHRGKFERADRGTLFLDEIGDLPLSSQAKLLRALEEEAVERVGAERPIPVNARFVAATNRNLEAAVAEGKFRADLFFRLSALQVHIPPLRERIEDIEYLIRHFIRLLNAKYGRNIVAMTREAVHLLKQYRWPGNVRELRNLMERLFAENLTEVIGLRSLKEWYEERVAAGRHAGNDPQVTMLPYRKAIPLGMDGRRASISETGAQAEREPFEEPRSVLDETTIREAFRRAGGNITKASRAIGIHKATFYRYLKQFGITRTDLET